ncbi:protein of unknown function [Dyadobacter soli]|uniref:DUF4153 domain-containing protein n=1 Tax=Dyadobacter soli TaxID=659014 RepID=A0A1G7QFL2_9BACT|nr:DUF4153 domain-containing protein [Dyadobacter soli]SDF97245.1 protein of unknown function [Dyadobacter soli]
MIKFPSLKTLSDSLLDTIMRYRWVTLIAFLKTILLIWLTETPFSEKIDRNEITRFCFVAALALPLFLAIQLAGEWRSWKPNVRRGLAALIIAALGGYYMLMDQNPDNSETYRFLIFLLGAHLFVSYAPFIGSGDTEGFWQFNKTLFLQFLNATLYSGTLYIGLLIAVQTVKYLFGIEYSFAVEMDLFLIVSCFFHTIFFLSKIPRPEEDISGYPNGLKVFTQYVLLPLEVVYLIILYAYVGKIVLQWQLPEGRIAYLVLAFSVAGIFALLLLYPLRKSSQERWVSIFARRFYLALLPLIVLLFIGIFRRINDYGITENRYIVGLLACWLAGIALYFLSGRRDDIRWVPVTLSIFCFLLPLGPWNIFVVSKNSQLKQFREILSRNHVLDVKNQITQRKTVTKDDRERLASIIQFFRSRELTGLESYFAGFKEKDKSDFQYYLTMENTLNKFVISEKQEESENYTNFSPLLAKNAVGISVSGFERALFVDANQDKLLGDGHVEIKIGTYGKTWTLYRDKKKVTVWNIADRVNALQASFGSHAEDVPQDSLMLTYGDYKMVFRSLSSDNSSYYGYGVLLYK